MDLIMLVSVFTKALNAYKSCRADSGLCFYDKFTELVNQIKDNLR